LQVLICNFWFHHITVKEKFVEWKN